jgi:hypothetical protein
LILKHSIKSFAREYGFVIVRKRAVPGKSITFKCDRSALILNGRAFFSILCVGVVTQLKTSGKMTHALDRLIAQIQPWPIPNIIMHPEKIHPGTLPTKNS